MTYPNNLATTYDSSVYDWGIWGVIKVI